MINLKGIIAQVMNIVNVHLVNFSARFACRFLLMAQFGIVVVQSFI